MQEEVNEKTISLCIKGGKITAQILKAALIKLLTEMDKKKQRGKGEKSQCKKTGRQSIKSLQKSGAQITNIVVTDNNIHVLGLEKDQIFALSLLFYFFQTIINAILPGHPVEGLDILSLIHI